MLAFEVTLNDEKLCVAGLYADGGVHVIMSASHYSAGPNQSSKGDLNVSGLIGHEHVSWVDGWGKLRVGDTVVVRLLETAQSDPPRRLELRIDKTDQSHLGPVQQGAQCSTCTKRESEVRKLLSIANDMQICSECVADFVVVLREEGIEVCAPRTD